jgi:large subunit ribosomal protein L13
MVHFIDATNLILGRLAVKTAKLALSGEEIVIVNCENAIISGKKKIILQKFKVREARTQPFTGPYRKRMPDRIVRSAIRGMLPHGRWSEESRGRKAFDRVKTFIGIPLEYKNQKIETFPEMSADKLKTQFYVTVGEISQLLRQV